MTNFVIVAGLISALSGALFVLIPAGFWYKLGAILNTPLFQIEHVLREHHIVTGITFLLIGVWGIFFTAQAAYHYLYLAGGCLVVAIGLLYLFFPDWMLRLSQISDQQVVSFDKIAIGARISLGIVLLMAAIYIFLKLNVILRVK